VPEGFHKNIFRSNFF